MILKIYSIKIKAVYYSNLNYNNIIETAAVGVVTETATQTLTNKTLDSPIITVGAINVSPTELSYLDGVTSSIQTQLNNKGSSTPVYSTKWLTAPFAALPNSIGNFAGAIFYIPISVSKTMTFLEPRILPQPKRSPIKKCYDFL